MATVIPSAGDELAVKWEGVLIAATAFILTRGLLVSALYTMDGIIGTIPRLVPLIVGLGIAVYGVDLAVSTHDRNYARTVVRWFLFGTFGMLGIVTLPLLGTTDPVGSLLGNEVLAAAVVGGGLGGILVGVRTAKTKQQRGQLERQADQAELVNRLLRHEVLNAMTAIRGHAKLLSEGKGTERSASVVEEGGERITRTIEDVGYIVRTSDESAALGTIDLDEAISAARDRLPDSVDLQRGTVPSLQVRGDSHLVTAIAELLDTAYERSDDVPRLSVGTTATTAELTVTAGGEWLSEREIGALTERLPEYDSPDVGYSLSITNLLVGQYGGSVDATIGNGQTTVVLQLPQTTEGARARESQGIERRGLEQATVAGLVAGIAMGVALQALSGQIGVIGALYGSPTPLVGWITHLFHSVVFATIFAGLAAHPSVAPRVQTGQRILGSAVAFGLLLWLVAAGIIMGFWLNAVGIPASIPNLGEISLIGHLLWGLVLGLVLWLYPDRDST